jgi:hypothetical protein
MLLLIKIDISNVSPCSDEELTSKTSGIVSSSRFYYPVFNVSYINHVLYSNEANTSLLASNSLHYY